jgi:soluble lytic murein transglycosylase-like protein
MTRLLLLLQIPVAAWQYRGELARSAYRVFGPGAPVATLAAQIHQESNWRAGVTARDGGQGLAQFMPRTAEDIAKRYPADCAPSNPYSPRWAFLCRDRYMFDLFRGIRSYGGSIMSSCSKWSFALRAYNGGPGWLTKDRRLANSTGLDANDWRATRDVNAGRSATNHRINREYPERIERYALRYENAGWGAAACP